MKNLSDINNLEFNKLSIASPDHKELADDDCGLPESPLFSNYSKYLWKRAVSRPKFVPAAGASEKSDGNNKQR